MLRMAIIFSTASPTLALLWMLLLPALINDPEAPLALLWMLLPALSKLFLLLRPPLLLRPARLLLGRM